MQMASDDAAPAVAVALNDTPADLPTGDVSYACNDDPTAPAGSTKLLVHVYGPVGAVWQTSSLDGSPAPVYLGHERGRPVWWTYVPVLRGQERVLEVWFTEPAVAGVEPRVLTQPMVRDSVVSVTSQPGC